MISIFEAPKEIQVLGTIAGMDLGIEGPWWVSTEYVSLLNKGYIELFLSSSENCERVTPEGLEILSGYSYPSD